MSLHGACLTGTGIVVRGRVHELARKRMVEALKQVRSRETKPAAGGEALRVSLDPRLVAMALTREGRYVTIARVSSLLGVTPRTTGKVLAWLERQGLARRYLRSTYMILASLVDNS